MSSSSKKSKKRSRAKSANKSKQFKRETTNHILPPSSTILKVSISSDTHKANAAKVEKENKRRPRSPLSPLRTWIHKSTNSPTKKSNSKKKSTKKGSKSTQRRARSHSNSFFDAKPQYYNKTQTQATRPRTQTPNNASKYNNYNNPKKQLKFTNRNDKIIIDNSKKYVQKNKKTNNTINTSTKAIKALSQPSVKRKKKSFVERASLKFSHRIASPTTNRQRAQTPNISSRSKSSKPAKKRGSFFSLNRDKKTNKTRSKSNAKSRAKHGKNNKSFKDKIFNEKKNGFNADIKQKHEKRSSLNMHKMRMIRALREESVEDNLLMLSDENSESIEVVKLRDIKHGSAHHKRGSSGIPSFFQKKLQFELRQYLDEKARLFIAYCMRMYALRITEEIFEVISRFHVIPFDSGFICLESDECSALTSISYHYPLVQLPSSSSMPTLDGIHDDRLRQNSPHSMPLPNTTFSRSLDQKLQSPKKKIIPNMANTFVHKSRSVECNGGSIALSQSESVNTPIVGDGFCDIEHNYKNKRKEAVIKKYKKKVHKKKRRDYNERKKKYNNLKRSGSLDRKRNINAHNLHSENLQKNNRIFYSSAPELSEDEVIDDFVDDADDDDFSQETDGFPDLNYSQLIPFKPRLQFEEENDDQSRSKSGTISNTMTFDSGRFIRNTPILNEKFSELDGYYADVNDINDLNDDASYSAPSDTTMTPRTPTITEENNSFFCKEFKLSFDSEYSQIQKIKKNSEWKKITNGDNGVAIAEWTLLSTPKVFDFYNNDIENIKLNKMRMNKSVGLGIGGFIDRTRGICDVSLAPIYYQYGGMDKNDTYYHKLDAYNLYTGDYITCSPRLPFDHLYDTASSFVRCGYQSTLIISGGQIYGRDVFDETQIQNKSFLYAPWLKSRYHDIMSTDAVMNDEFVVDKHGIINTLKAEKLIRRKSFDAPQDAKHAQHLQKEEIVAKKTRTSSKYAINFENILTRPSSRSISHRHSNKQQNIIQNKKKKNKKKKNIKQKERIIGDWLQGPQMLTARANHGSVAWDEHIVFICGGFGIRGRRIDSVEMLRMDKFTSIENVNKLRWKKCHSMSANKSNLVLIHWKPKTCIVSVGSGSKVVESYDPYKDAWKDLPPLNTHQISNKSCRFYYDSHSQTNCLMFLKFRNGEIKSMEFLDERVKLKKWQLINEQYVELFNAQIGKNKHLLQNIKPFCFA